jgi:hypothetical protein
MFGNAGFIIVFASFFEVRSSERFGVLVPVDVALSFRIGQGARVITVFTT